MIKTKKKNAYCGGTQVFNCFFFFWSCNTNLIHLMTELSSFLFLPLPWPVGEKSKWKYARGFRKRAVFPTLHWASELSTELLACVKRSTDVIEIDIAMLREKREQLSILHHRTPTSYAHTRTTHWKSSQSKLTARNREEKSKTIFFFFLFLKKSKSNCQLSEDYSTTVGSLTSPP